MSRRCPRPERLARLVSGEADATVTDHLATCAACTAAVTRDRTLVALVRAAPSERLDPRRRDSLLTMVLSAPDAELVRPRGGRRRIALAAVMAAAGIALVVGVSTHARDRGARVWSPPVAPSSIANRAPAPSPSPREPAVRPPMAPVTASPGARYAVQRVGPRLEVRLEQGAITLDGATAGATAVVIGDRLITASPDARYTVESPNGGRHTVQVFAGSVEIAGAGGRVIGAGETWSLEPPPPMPARPPPATARVPRSPRTTAAAPDISAIAPAPDAPRTGSSAFRTAWTELDAGRFTAAAQGFDRAADDPALAEDATYWAAIARARAGDLARARAGLLRFLDGFPRSPQAGAAHLALGRLLADDPPAARRHLEAAADDPDPRVSAAARAALAP